MATHSRRGIPRTHDMGKRLLTIALLAGIALVATSHDAHARTKEERCRDLGGEIGSDGNCWITTKDGTVIVEPAAGPVPAPQTSQKPITPGVKMPPTIQTGTPDLIPFNPNPGGGRSGFCVMDPSGKLIVQVKNQGSVPAPASKTSVRLSTVKGVVLDTPPIPAGGTVSLPGIEIPMIGSTKDREFEFGIAVDSQNTIDESKGEMNNQANGKCLG